MHPIVCQQIATAQADEVRRRAELRRAHAPVRRSRDHHAASRQVRSSLGRAWVLLTTIRNP